jgi:beta-lactam-binding protein with PASTA domain
VSRASVAAVCARMLDFALDSRSCATPRQGKEPKTIVSLVNRALLTLKRILIVIGIAIAFSIGLIGAIVLSLSSSKTTVPNIVGKDRITAENEISAARLNFRVRATRPASDAQPNTVLIQIPGAGQEVKVGQTVAVDISRPTKEGEISSTNSSNTNTNSASKQENSSSTSENANANDNKSKRKPANKNANDNLNGTSNRPANQNRNANRPRTVNTNENPTGTPAPGNQDVIIPPKGNTNRSSTNTNSNRRAPVTAPTP